MSKFSQKYDLTVEAEVRNWLQQLLNENIGEYELEKKLKDGVILCKLMQRLYQGTPADSLPAKCKNVNLKFRATDKPAVQMENIEIFLKAAEAYGVQQSGLFACNDLFEGRNMPMVMATILQVGSEAQRNKFQGPVCGPKPRQMKRRLFTRSQLRAGQTMIGLQSGTNRFASQSGMSFGSVRHISDIRCDDAAQEGQGILTQQAATNKYASQAGTRGFGAVRHISDIKSAEISEEGKAIIALQMGTNQFASQKGMKGFGAVRHVADIKADDVSADGMATLSLQSGTNKFASQKGMTGFGAQRHISDIKVTELCDEIECIDDDEYDDYREYEQYEDYQ